MRGWLVAALLLIPSISSEETSDVVGDGAKAPIGLHCVGQVKRHLGVRFIGSGTHRRNIGFWYETCRAEGIAE